MIAIRSFAFSSFSQPWTRSSPNVNIPRKVLRRQVRKLLLNASCSVEAVMLVAICIYWLYGVYKVTALCRHSCTVLDIWGQGTTLGPDKLPGNFLFSVSWCIWCLVAHCETLFQVGPRHIALVVPSMAEKMARAAHNSRRHHGPTRPLTTLKHLFSLFIRTGSISVLTSDATNTGLRLFVIHAGVLPSMNWSSLRFPRTEQMLRTTD